MRVHHYIRITEAEGPGKRFALWVQGCSHKCPGCFAKDTWDANAGTDHTVDCLLDLFNEVSELVEGATILGGEPFDQAKEIAVFARAVHSAGKTVITFTGYDYNYLIGRDNEAYRVILENTDILIDGPYIKELPEYSRPLVGSTNQNIRFLSDRISPEVFYSYRNRFEIRIAPSGTAYINGMGDTDKIQELFGGSYVRL